MHARQMHKKDQFIKWNNGYWVDTGTRYFFTGLKWVQSDAFEVNPVFSNIYPWQQKNGQGPKWLLAGQKCGHAEPPILLKKLSGPLHIEGRFVLFAIIMLPVPLAVNVEHLWRIM